MDAGFFAPQKVNRTGLALVITLHAAAIGALALSKMDMPDAPDFPRFKVKQIWEQPIPDELPPVETERAVIRRNVPATPEPVVDTPIDTGPPIETIRTDDVVPIDPLPGPTLDPVQIADSAPPVRIAAMVDPRAALQPPYPPSAERLGEEGTVKVRVLVGVDGRVKAVERLSGTNDAFWKATERHALRNWRFRPATLDGRAIESWQEMSVRFQLSARV